MIYVIGLGPGAKSYILPEAINLVKNADKVIGAVRNLESIKEYTSETMDLSLGLANIRTYLHSNVDKNIAVVVSGDTGFHSLLSFVKRNVPEEHITVVPGISSLQYFYSRLKKGYEASSWVSIHGRDTDLTPYLESKKEIAVLTDKKCNNQYIAQQIIAYGIKDAKIFVGENLSYPNEKITELTLVEALDYKAEDLSVVVVVYE